MYVRVYVNTQKRYFLILTKQVKTPMYTGVESLGRCWNFGGVAGIEPASVIQDTDIINFNYLFRENEKEVRKKIVQNQGH